MSLDVYLTLAGIQDDTYDRIYIREDGQTKEITRDEWDARFPGREPVSVVSHASDGRVYCANITHNLYRMADEAGISKALWDPEEIGITHATQLVNLLRDGLALLNSEPERFRMFNPKNGWGTYEGLCQFVAEYLEACKAYPDAEVSVWG